MLNQNDNQTLPGQDELQKRFSLLPVYVFDWLCSFEIAQNNATIITKFNLTGKNSLLATITREIITKEILPEKLSEAIQQKLAVDGELAKKLAIEVAIKQLLPIREHLVGIEKLVVQWGGSLPPVLPPRPESTKTTSPPAVAKLAPVLAESKSSSKPPVPQAPAKIITKNLRQIVQDNKEALNQILTSSALKIADFDQPVRGTIKNWLADYVKQKGATRHTQLERGDYLFKSDNAKKLDPQEKSLVAKILKSYDEDILLLYNEEEKIILLTEEEATVKESISQQKIAPPETKYPYRETIEKSDLAGPLKTPEENSHVINLKNLP